MKTVACPILKVISTINCRRLCECPVSTGKFLWTVDVGWVLSSRAACEWEWSTCEYWLTLDGATEKRRWWEGRIGLRNSMIVIASILLWSLLSCFHGCRAHLLQQILPIYLLILIDRPREGQGNSRSWMLDQPQPLWENKFTIDLALTWESSFKPERFQMFFF